MKSILVATDFSASADNAVRYAANMAKQFGAQLTVLHVYQIPISMSDVPVLMVSAEELKNNADEGLKNVKADLSRDFPGLTIETISRLGDVTTEVNELSEKTNPFAVVVGKHGASGVERFLFGSTALSLIRSSKTPVITVPDTTVEFRIHNIALASDGNALEGHEAWIRNFVSETKARLHIVHVKTEGEEKMDLHTILPDLHPDCHTLDGENFSDAIGNFMLDNNMDMLMVLPQKHSMIERMIFKTHTSELIKNIVYPVLTIGTDS